MVTAEKGRLQNYNNQREAINSARTVMMSDREFEQFYTLYWLLAVQLAAACGAGSDAEDVAQEALLSLRSFRADCKVSDKVRVVCRVISRAKGKYKQKMGGVRLAASLEEQYGILAYPATDGASEYCPELVERLKTLMNSLSPHQRTVLVLHYWNGWTLPEIARELKTSLGNIKSRAHRGREALHIMIKTTQARSED